PGFLPEVAYGTPLELFGYSGSGQPLVYTGAGGYNGTGRNDLLWHEPRQGDRRQAVRSM
ncbi:MAG: hypothetical protein QG661_2665, partial [Actinomycetota bacterium]|nr:hypothetical protein [Actinomycetota bacterium]